MLVWLDIETTGLDFKTSEILEIGIKLTDDDLNVTAENSWLTCPKYGAILNMPPEVRKMHTINGLLQEVQKLSLVDNDYHYVERRIISWLADQLSQSPTFVGFGQPVGLILAGSSVHFDRYFLRKFMPNLESRFSHRHVDVSSLKELVQRWCPAEAKYLTSKEKKHRVLSDLDDSIAELKYYRVLMFGGS